jgi:hypothetical protein
MSYSEDGGQFSVTIVFVTDNIHKARQRLAFTKDLVTENPKNPQLPADLMQRIAQSIPLSPKSVYTYRLSTVHPPYPLSPPQIFLTKVGDQDINVDVTGKITTAMYETYRARYAGEGHPIHGQITGDATSEEVSFTEDWSPVRVLCCLRLTPDVEQDVEPELAPV